MNPEAKGTVLTLVGPPGTGKTTLAKSIATALNRKYIKVSLGGVRDEAEVRGHRRTYIGAMPGKIITAMKKAGVINPVILLDELDKMSSDMRGDPASAMLEVLDYEQNINFQDHYIEEDYDLSRVMFVATANYYENIPEALIDRLEIVHLSSYTEIEKLNIAKNYLTPAVLENTRVDNKLFKIDDDIIKYLIRHYTREAGVRGLRRVLETLARKIIVNVLNNKIKGTLTIDRKLINKYLGPEKYDYSKKEKTNQVGVATGLA
jgi:ATP-dependent Lon protease